MSEGDIKRLNRMYQCPEQIIRSQSVSKKSNIEAMDDADDDMVLTKEQKEALFSTNSAKRNGLVSTFHHWPNGVVPYDIDMTFREFFWGKISLKN